MNGVTNIAIDDSTKMLWIATSGGLFRYDGQDMKFFGKNTMPSINAERMSTLLKNRKNEIYGVTEWDEIFKINAHTIFSLPNHKKKAIPYSSNIYTFNGLQISEKFWQYEDTSSVLKTISACTDPRYFYKTDTTCFIGDAVRLFYFTASKKLVPLRPLLPDSIKSMFTIGHHFFVLTQKKQFKEITANAEQASISNVLINSPFPITAAIEKIFWREGRANPIMLHNKALYELSFENNILQATLICTSIPVNIAVKDIIYNKASASIVIATPNNGIYILKKQQLIPLNEINFNNNIPQANYVQIPLSDSSIITSSLQVYGSREKTSIPLKSNIEFFASDFGDSTIWYNIGNCVYQYNYKNAVTTLKYSGVTYDATRRAMFKKKDTAFLMCGDGIRFFTNTSSGLLTPFTQKKAELFQPFEIINCKQNEVLVAGYIGVFKLNYYTGKVDSILATNGTPARTIKKIDNYYFIGTYGKGIYIYDGKTVKSIRIDNQNNLLYAHCFVPDNQGYCWISSNNGLYKASIADMINAFETNNKQPIFYYYYGKEDGMMNSELNGGCVPCAVSLKNGTISFPSMQGVVWVKPNQLKNIFPQTPIYIDELVADKQYYNIDSVQQIRLPATTKQVSIQLDIVNWSSKENLQVYYQFDDDSLEVMDYYNGRKIVLNAPSYGHHRLKIIKLNGFGKNNLTEKIIEFDIKKPWYLQWWFFILVVMFIMLSTWLWVRIRTKWLIKKQEQLEKIIAEKTTTLEAKNMQLENDADVNRRVISVITHDILTPLRFMHTTAADVLKHKANTPEKMRDELIQEISTTGERLESLAIDILNLIRFQFNGDIVTKEHFNLHQLVEELHSNASALLKRKHLEFSNNISKDCEVYLQKSIIKIVLYNVLMNAIKFSNKGCISFKSNATNGKISIIIEDQGVGMTEERIEHIMTAGYVNATYDTNKKMGIGLGYLIIRYLIKFLGTDFKITSKPNEGTKVVISWKA